MRLFLPNPLRFWYKDRNPGRQTGDVDPETHQACCATDVGKKDDDPNAHTLAEFHLFLDRGDRPVKVGRHTDRYRQPHGTDKAVEDVKAAIDRQKTLPLIWRQRAQPSLFREAKPR